LFDFFENSAGRESLEVLVEINAPEREVRRRGKVVRGSGYEIVVMVEFILIASASFSAPTGPIIIIQPN
jgi:hypothetical protein